MKEVKYADCANCIHRVFDEETYLKTNGACLVDENDIERFKKIVCEGFEAKEVSK